MSFQCAVELTTPPAPAPVAVPRQPGGGGERSRRPDRQARARASACTPGKPQQHAHHCVPRGARAARPPGRPAPGARSGQKPPGALSRESRAAPPSSQQSLSPRPQTARLPPEGGGFGRGGARPSGVLAWAARLDPRQAGLARRGQAPDRARVLPGRQAPAGAPLGWSPGPGGGRLTCAAGAAAGAGREVRARAPCLGVKAPATLRCAAGGLSAFARSLPVA